ncbi:hypothetical protein AB4Y33_43160, partial [Paraburkholderia sp. BR14319]|uniref:hypothetical protein n=1 Tax=Paraburkholderia sp. BR14319 TaxID=3237005 RepID=UPI0034D258E4
ASLLERLADIPKPESVDVRPLFPFLKDKRWLVRHSAIQSLKRDAHSSLRQFFPILPMMK